MRYLRVRNWEAYQHFDAAKGEPPWIKTYPDQLDQAKHPTFAGLSDGAKLTLHHLRLLAAKCENKIPETWLNKDRLNMQTRPRLAELEACQFIEFDNGSDMSNQLSKPLSPSRASGVCNLSILSSSVNHEIEFGELWRDLLEKKIPRPLHKIQAFKHFRASVESADDLSKLRLALDNYRKSDRVKRGFVQDASTWFHNWRDWENSNADRPRSSRATEQTPTAPAKPKPWLIKHLATDKVLAGRSVHPVPETAGGQPDGSVPDVRRTGG